MDWIAHLAGVACGLLLAWLAGLAAQRRLERALREGSFELAGLRKCLDASVRFAQTLNQAEPAEPFVPALTCIAETVHCPIVAIYLVTPAGPLECRAAVGADGAPLDTDLLQSSGLPQAVLDARETKSLRGPFHDPRLRIRAGLGDLDLHLIRAWPVQFQDDVLGVLLIGFDQEPRSRQLAFIDACLEQLGTRLWSFRVEEIRRGLVSELHDQARELERVRFAEEQASRSKSMFLAKLSHEIRTPLTAILGYAELMLREGSVNEAHVDHLHTVMRNGEHLLAVINDVLDFAKIESARMTCERIACSPFRIAHDVVTLLGGQALDKGLRLDLSVAGPIPVTVCTDPFRLRQILINLVGNAVKFTHSGRVELRMQIEHGDSRTLLRFDIVDTGIGMGGDKLTRLFQPFVQLDDSTPRQFGGSGLGLTIAKQLTELLGGRLEVASEPGKGSTFTVLIDPGPLVGVPCYDTPEEALAGLRTPTPETEESRLHGRVLVADDSPDNRHLVAFLLVKAGAEVSLANDGRQAVEMVREAARLDEPFGLVLMDMHMPDLDGMAATRELRQGGSGTPIVALTANALEGTREQCLAAGCDDFITKPVSRRRLLSIAARYLGAVRQTVS